MIENTGKAPEKFAIPGFLEQKKGPLSGLLWMDFSNIEIHGHPRGTPEREEAEMKKLAVIRKFIDTEVQLHTKHYDSKGNLLRKSDEIMSCYLREGGFFIEVPKERRWKFEGLAAQKDLFLGDADDRPQKDDGREGPSIIH